MTSGGIGSIRGQIRISATQALAAYASVRRANAATRASLLGASAAFAKVGVVALAAAAPIALLFGKAVSAAADFEKKIDYFGAVTNATKEDMQAVADKAMAMAKTTVFSASDMADAFVEFGKAGISTKDILNGVADATANLAQAADISMGEASNIMASQMATFDLGANKAGHVADVLAGAANASIIDVQDLAYSLKYAGGIAASTGVSFDSLVTAISLLGQRGIKGSTAGTSLRQIMVSLTTQTKQAKNQLEDLGIITKKNGNLFIDQTGHIKSLSEVFQILQDKEKGLTQAEQLAANKRIFNSRALSAVQILMKDGAKGFVDMQASINKVTASDVAHKRLDNLAGDWQRLKNNIQTLLIQVGGPLQNFFRQIVQGLTSMVQWFASLSPRMQTNIVIALGVVGAFLVVLGVLSLMISLVLKTIAVYKDLRLAFLFIRAIIMGTVLPALRSLFVAMMTNPIFLLIAGIALLVAGFIYCWKNFKGFRDFFKNAWKAIQGFFTDAWNTIKSVFNWIVNAAKKAGDLYWRYYARPILLAMKAVGEAFMAAYRWISNAISNIIGFISRNWRLIIAIVMGPVGIAIDFITAHWTGLVLFFKTIGLAIWTAIKWTWNAIVTVTMAVFNTIKNYIMLVFNFYKAIITTTVTIIKNIVTAAWNVIKTITMAVWNGIKSFFIILWNGIKAVFTAGIGLVKRVINSAWSVIGGPLKAFWRGIVSFFRGIWSNITGIFQRLWSGVKTIISNFVSPILGVVRNLITGIWNGIQGGASRIWNAITGVFNQVVTILGGFYNNMLTIGGNIVKGIWNGIVGMAQWLYDKVKSFLTGLWNGIKSFLGISSPSKKARDEIGKNIVLGLAQGLLQNSAAIYAAKQLAHDTHHAISEGTKAAQKQLVKDQEAYGQWLVRGVISGLNRNSRAGIRSAMNFAAGVKYAIKNGLDATAKLAQQGMVNIAKYMADAMDKAQDKLKDAKDKFAAQKQTIVDAFNGAANFTGLGAGVDAAGNQTAVTLDNMMKQFRAKATEAGQFAARIDQLRKKGLSLSLIQQLAEAGPDSSGAQVAELAKASSAQIQQINNSQTLLARAAQRAGNTVAGAMYSSGIKAAQGLVDGIKSKQKQLLQIAAAMGKNIVTAVKKELKIKSPSRVMRDDVGAMMVRGLAAGITNNQSKAIDAVRNMSAAMVDAHTGQLKTSINASWANDYLGAARRSITVPPKSAGGHGFNVENLNVINPTPERASDTLPKTIRKVSYMATGPSR